MKRKIGAHVSIAGGLPNSIKNIQAIGGNALQIFAGSPRTWARSIFFSDQVKEFNKQVQVNNLGPIFIHALYLVNLGSDNPSLLKKSKESLLTDMQNGDLIDAAGVIVHIGSHQGRGFESAKSKIASIITSLLSQTKKTFFIIENSAGQKGKIGSLEEIRDLIEATGSPRVKICLDSAHLFSAGFDLRDKKEIENLVATLSQYKLLDKLVCLHLNDSKAVLGSGRDLHQNLGDGEIGSQGLTNFINHPHLKHLPIILEVPGIDGKGPDAHNIAIAQKLSTHT